MSHLSSPVLSQLPDMGGSSSQHTGTVPSGLLVLSGLSHSAHSPVGLV